MSTYQDVVGANLPQVAWALVEASGNDHAPYVGQVHLTSSGTRLYQQAGPFANSLSIHFGGNGGLAATNPTVFNPPLTLEAWFKADAVTTGASRMLFYYGNNGANGFGAYIASGTPFVTLLHGGVAFGATTLQWPDTNWHLLQLVQNTTTEQLVYLDGVLQVHNTMGAYAAPSTNLLFLQDATPTNFFAGNIAMPAVYPWALSGSQAYASYLGSTNPNAALGLTLSQGVNTGQGTNALLNAILDAVTVKGY